MSVKVSQLNFTNGGETAGPWLVSGGETGDAIRAFDWASTPLGPLQSWPHSLRFALGLCLNSRFPMFLWWGPDLINFYNDAYVPILGQRHPGALGKNARELWQDVWPAIAPQVEAVFERGEASWQERLLLVTNRNGYDEDAYFTYSHSPVFDEHGGVAGLICVVSEETAHVRAEAEVRRTEAALRGSEQRLQRVLETDAVGVLFFDWTGTVIDANDVFLRRTGYTREEVARRELTWQRMTPPEWVAVSEEQMQKLTATGRTGPYEKEYFNKDGSRSSMLLAGRDLGDGTISEYCIDISHQKQAAEELRRSEEFNRRVLESSSDCIKVLDLDGNLEMMSDGGQNAFGATDVSHLLRRCWIDFWQGKDREAARQAVLQAREGQVGSFEGYCPTLTGEGRWWSIVVSPMLGADGRSERLVCVSRDITARRRADEALRQSEQRFRLLADAVPQIVWVIDTEGRLEFFNRQWSDYTGIPFEPTTAADVVARYIHPEDGPRTIKIFESARQSGATFQAEHRIRSKEGSYRWFLVRAQPHRDLITGEIIRWFGSSTDIHDGVLAKSKLEFLHRIGEATRSLADPTDVMAVIARLLGEHLQVSRCAYADVQPDTDYFTILHDYTSPGIASTTGNYHLSLFGPRAAADQRQGRTLVIYDVDRELTPEGGASMFNALGIKALVCCPLVKQGRLMAMMAVHQTIPRAWSADEVELVEATVDRAWAYIERSRALRTLAESEARFRHLADHAPVMVWVTEPDGACTYLSQSWYEFTGQTDETALGFGWLDATHPDDRELAERAFRDANANNGPFRVEYRLRRKDGIYRWAIDAAAPRLGPNGEFLGYVGSVLDITERKTADEERERLLLQVQAEHERTVEILESVSDAFYAVDSEFRFTYVNHKAEQLWQRRREDLLGRHYWTEFPRAVGSESYRMHLQVMRERAPLHYETISPLLGRWVDVSLYPEARGGVSCYFRDITERKHAEEALQHSHQELERTNRELEEFAYVASHDLQEPLRMVNIYSQLLLKRFVPEEPQAQEYATLVRQGVKRMETLIRDLLTYSRTVQRDEQPVGAADLSAALDEAQSVLKSRIEELGAVIQAGPLPIVRGEATQLAHVFQNLLSNALKYCNKDVKPMIQIRAERETKHWVIAVADNGIGFEPQYAEKIFGLFKRLHKDEYPGTGLGLAICQRIVERYGGRMWAESQPGIGSTFYFLLPMVTGYRC